MTRMTYKVSLLMIMIVSYFILSGRSGGCDSKKTETLNSPVQAICTLYESESGAVRAELVLISTLPDPDRFIDTATNVQFEVPGGTRIPMSQVSDGHYVVTSADDDRLVFTPDGAYLFKFELADEQFTGPDYVNGYFVGEITAPDERPTFVQASQDTPGQDHTADIYWQPSFQRGIYSVTNPDGVITDSNWDFSHPEFDGSKWSSLLLQNPQEHTIQGQAFQSPGEHIIAFAGCNMTGGFNAELSSQLGMGSGFLACSEVTTTLDLP